MVFRIYVDVLFIINFIADYLLLSATALFIKKRAKMSRKIMAACVGAMFGCVVFFLPTGPFWAFPLSACIAPIMVAITFGAKKGTAFFRRTAVFFLVSFAGAGAGFALLSLGNKYSGISYFIKGGMFYAGINAYLLLAIFLFALGIVHFSCGYIKKMRIKSRYLYDVTIVKDGRSVTEQALFDTGNFLTDPLSQRSVLVAEWDSVSDLFHAESLAEAIAEAPGEFLYIPCRGISGNTGLFAFCPDEIVSPEIFLNDAAFVGISETPLDGDGNYRMILPNTASITERM